MVLIFLYPRDESQSVNLDFSLFASLAHHELLLPQCKMDQVARAVGGLNWSAQELAAQEASMIPQFDRTVGNNKLLVAMSFLGSYPICGLESSNAH